MRILTRYLLRASIGPFLFALSVLTGLLLVNTVARRFEELAGKGLSIGVIAEVFALSIPHIIALTLPMAVLVATLYTFSRLASDNEITALKASGVNLVRLLVPLMLMGALLGTAMVWFNDSLLPETNHRLKNLLVDIGRKSPTLQLKEQVINRIPTRNVGNRFYLRAREIDYATSRLRDVVIWDLSRPGQERTIYADSGRMAFNRQRTDLFLTLNSGFVHQLEGGRQDRFQRIFFNEQTIRVEQVGSVLSRTEGETYRGERELSLTMLLDRVASAREELTEIRDDALETSRAALTVALEGRRLGPNRSDAAMREQRSASDDAAEAVPVSGADRRDATRRRMADGTQDTAVSDTVTAGATADGSGAPAAAMSRPDRPGRSDVFTHSTAAELGSLEARASSTQRQIDSFSVEYHKKFAIPFACIVFVLIGAPLAIRFPRGGAGMVIAISLGIFAIYYVGLIGGEKLGDEGIVGPFLAMWVPNVIFLLAGGWGLLRVGRETSTTRGGGWDDLWQTVRRTLGRPFRRLRSASPAERAG